MELLPPLMGYITVMVVFVLVCHGTSNRWLAPNNFIGIRTKQTLKNEEAWNIAHQHFYPYAIAVIMVAAVFSIIIAILLLFNFTDDHVGLMVISGYILILLIVIMGGMKSHFLAKEYNKRIKNM